MSGERDFEQVVDELADVELDVVYAGPCQSAMQTAKALAKARQLKVKTLEKLQNLDHGLWHGKLISEVKEKQPKVYRQWQDHPEQVCPPEGESVLAARQRVCAVR